MNQPEALDGALVHNMPTLHYYNDSDRFVVQWLKNLIRAGHLPAGDVDDRRIEEVNADDLRGYTQCHFFSGIGGWPLALKLAGWPEDRPVWTGSCPCQPLSGIGLQKGAADERHLWPAFFNLIAECRPPVVFGEQVAGALGREWLSAVRLDLEAIGYACGAADLCAASVGAPHIRQRLYWVAYRLDGDGSSNVRLDNADGPGLEGLREGHQATEGWFNPSGPAAKAGEPGKIRHAGQPGSHDSFWSAADWLLCRDGNWRPVEPGTFPLAHGVPARVGRLRAYGNAIVPQLAAEFVKAADAVVKNGIQQDD